MVQYGCFFKLDFAMFAMSINSGCKQLIYAILVLPKNNCIFCISVFLTMLKTSRFTKNSLKTQTYRVSHERPQVRVTLVLLSLILFLWGLVCSQRQSENSCLLLPCNEILTPHMLSMALKWGEHLAQLRDRVTIPGAFTTPRVSLRNIFSFSMKK